MQRVLVTAFVALLLSSSTGWAGTTVICSEDHYSTNCYGFAKYGGESGSVAYCSGTFRTAGNINESEISNNCEWENVGSCGAGADVVLYNAGHAAIVEACSGDSFVSTEPNSPVSRHHLSAYGSVKGWYEYIGPSNCEEEEEEEEEEVNLDATYVNGGPTLTLHTGNNLNNSQTATVTMDGTGTFTWTKTSGTVNVWNSYNGGRNMYIVLGSGNTASFTVSQNGTSRTIFFY